MPNFHGTQVEATVWLWLRDLLKLPEKITEGLAAEREESARKYGPLRYRLALIENRLAETQAEQAELLALYLSRKFKPEVLDARKAQLDKAEADLSRERAELADYLKAEMLTDEQARTLELELADIRDGYSGPINSEQLRQWRTQALEGLPQIFEPDQKALRELEAQHAQERDALYAEMGRLTTELSWLKKKVDNAYSRAERVAMLGYDASDLSLSRQARLLSLNRTSVYYQPVAPSAEDFALKRRIDEIYTQWPFYGSRKITAETRKTMPVNRKAVQRHTQEMGLVAICPGPQLSKPNPAHRIFPHLLRGLSVTAPNHVWGIEIVCMQMTKTAGLPIKVGGDDITDFDIRFRDHYTVN